MAEQQGETSSGTSRGPRGWLVAVAAVGIGLTVVAGGAALALLLPAAAPPAPTLSSFPTFALPTQTDLPAPATPTEAPTDLSAIVGAWCIPRGPAQSGVVVEVLDGDTVQVRLDAGGSVVPVRYAGVDAPALEPPGQFMAAEAKDLNAALIQGQPVRLLRDVSDADEDGHLLRYVVTADTFVNLELVMRGAARTLPSPPDVACLMTFQQAEQQATADRQGLWSGSGVTPVATSGIGEWCNCRGRDLDCRDFASWMQAQSCFRYCKALGFGDVFHLDNDGNGVVCPGKP